LTVETLTAYGGGLAHGDLFLWTGAALIALALIGLVLSRNRESASLAALLWLVPLGLVLALGFRSGLFEIRYLVVGLPGLMLLAGLGLTRISRSPVLLPAVVAAAIAPAGMALF